MPTSEVVRDPRKLGMARPTSPYCVPRDAHAMQSVADGLGFSLDFTMSGTFAASKAAADQSAPSRRAGTKPARRADTSNNLVGSEAAERKAHAENN